MTIDVAEVKRRLVALLNDPNLVNEYVRQYGPTIDIKHIKAIKERKNNAFLHEEDAKEEGNDPVFKVPVRCPVCNQQDISCFELRAKSQQIGQNRFLVPLYKGAFGYKTTDYTLIAVTVCPRCLFASPDKKDFNRQATGASAEAKTQLTSGCIMSLQEKIGERKALLKAVSDFRSYFERPRFFEAAIDSYRLAMARAKVEAWYEQPYSFFKLGSYSLKIAKIIKDCHGDNREVLQESLGYFEEAFKTSNCPSEEIEMQVIYLIIALFLKLGDLKKAITYIGVFSNLSNARVMEMRDNPSLNTVAIDKWSNRAKLLWAEREDPDLFKDE